MKNTLYLIFIILLFISCSKQTGLSKEFDCASNLKIENAPAVSDFKQNFTLYIPSHWKTELYYNATSSEIFTADTTRQLSETYILDASFNLGEMKFDKEFIAKTDSLAILRSYEIIQHEISTFQSNASYWFVLKGTKNKFPYHQFNLTVKLSNNTYFNSYVEIYGNQNIEGRICEAISILERIKFLQ